MSSSSCLCSTVDEIDAMLSRLEQSMDEIFAEVRSKDIKVFSDPCTF